MEDFMESKPISHYRALGYIKTRSYAITYSPCRNQRKTAGFKARKGAPIENNRPAHQQIDRCVEPARRIKPAKLNRYSYQRSRPNNR